MFHLKGSQEISPEESSVNDKVFILIIFFTLFIKLLTTMMIETGGDAVTLWYHVKQLYFGLPYEITHQSVRFGLLLPVYIVMKIFGPHPIVYYIIPFISSLILVAILYRIGVMLANRTIALFGCILLNIFPWSVVAGLQLLPGYIAATYIFISFFLMLKFHESGGKRIVLLMLSGFFFFLSYGAKETTLFFLPGFFLSLWLMTRRFSHLILFGAVPLALFIGETIFYYVNYGLPFGRLSVVTKTHFEGPMTRVFPMKSFWSLFGRFTKMALYWKVTFYLYFVAALWNFATSMKKEIRYIAIITFSFVFFQTFSVKSISPVIPTQPFNDRHMDLAIPGVMIIISAFFYDIIFRIRSLMGKSGAPDGSGKRALLFPLGVVAFFTVFAATAYLIVLTFFPNFERGNFFTRHPFALVFKYKTLLNDAYAGGTPIIIRKSEPLRFRTKVDAVNKFIASGKSEEEACREAGVDSKEYKDSLMRVTEGDYKAFNVFTYVFWNGAESLKTDPALYPEIDRVIFSGKPFGIIMDKRYRVKDYTRKALADGRAKVLELTVKPFTVQEMTLEEFLKKPSPVYD